VRGEAKARDTHRAQLGQRRGQAIPRKAFSSDLAAAMAAAPETFYGRTRMPDLRHYALV
jgi:hypothetical protein